MKTCVCGTQVITARLSPTQYATFDATPTEDGEYAVWCAPRLPGAPAGAWLARHSSDGDRFAGTLLRRPHACPGPAGTQMQLEIGGT